MVATTEQFAQRLRTAIQADTLADFRAAYRSSAILVLEAIDRLAEQPVLVQHELIHTLDALQRAGRLLVITARVAIRTISGLDPLLTSRLVAGLALLVSPPTRAARLEILRQIANLLGLVRRERDLQGLADAVVGTVPELLSALLSLPPPVGSPAPISP